MRILRLSVFAISFCLLFTLSCESPSVLSGGNLKVGETVPSFELTDIKGEKRSLSDYKGKVVFLNFWAAWCGPCVMEMPAIERVSQLFKDRDFVVIGINSDLANNKSNVEEFAKSYGLSFPILLDPTYKVAKLFGVNGFPETFFIDKEGKLKSLYDPVNKREQMKIISDRPWDSAEYIKLIEKLL